MVIMVSLEKCQALLVYDCDNYFWSGIQPTSLCNILELELRSQNLWMDQTLPPSMGHVIDVATSQLECATYQPRGRSLRTKSANSRGRMKCAAEMEDSSEENSESESSSSSKDKESDSSEEESSSKVRLKRKKGNGRKEEGVTKDPKLDERESEKPEPAVQSNIEDLVERFKCLELKLGEQTQTNEGQPPKIRMIYCIMCGKQGHVIRDCAESKFFLGQGICRMDLNNRVVMSDGSSLLHAEGDRGAAKIIRLKLAGASPAAPTSTSASNVEVTAAETNLNDELTELAILGAMEFEVVPVEQTVKFKWTKLYDCSELKKVVEKTLPKAPPRLGEPIPNKAYVKLPPVILKCPISGKPVQPVPEDKEMEDVTPSEPKGKQKEVPAVVPTLSCSPEVAPNKPKTDRVVPLRKELQFEVAKPKATNEKPKYQPLQYRYSTELMNKMDPKKVFQNLLSQPITLKLGEVLGSSFKLAQWFQTATKLQHFAVLQMGVAEVDEERDTMESGDPVKFLVNSGEARSSNAFTEELYEMTYQTMLHCVYKEQFTHFVPEVNLARPHEYRAMVMAHLNGKIGEHDYMMLVDSRSELTSITLQQAQEMP